MVRAPCCQKKGLKKGPWTRDEDEILINYVTLHGHENWRSLPKQAGLLRCGKSCRLRWINYLRPDIKRGNFSEEEEETIISLHQLLGNRWSAIAARLPGRTDNEIKNVWHTHLKKRINKIQQSTAPTSNTIQISEFKKEENYAAQQSTEESILLCSTPSTSQYETEPSSPQQQSSLTTTTTTSVMDNIVSMNADDLIDFLQVDESFWSQVFSSSDNSASTSDEFNDDEFHLHFPEFDGYGDDNSSVDMNNISDSFWYNILTNSSGQLPVL